MQQESLLSKQIIKQAPLLNKLSLNNYSYEFSQT